MDLNIPSTQPFVPVFTGGDIGAYSLAREFHEAFGVKSVIISTYANRVVGNSSIADVFPMGHMYDPEKVVKKFLAVAQAAQINGTRPLLLVPGYDHLVRIMIEHHDLLSKAGYHLPQLTTQQLDQAALKDEFYELCESLGVKYPRTVIFNGQKGAQEALRVIEKLRQEQWDYPLILKANDGGTWADTNFEGRRKVHYLETEQELTELLEKIVQVDYQDKLIIQQFIPGPDSALRILTQFRSRNGETVLSGLAEVVVEDHAVGLEGNSRALLVNPNRAVEESGEKILDALNWHGFGMFDIKIHAKTQEPYFLEMNPRMGRHHYYLTAAGANPAPYMVREFLEKEPHPARKKIEGPAMSTTIPLWLARKYAAPHQIELIRLAKKSNNISRPLDYPADRSLTRSLYLLYRDLRSPQEVKHIPGTMNT